MKRLLLLLTLSLFLFPALAQNNGFEQGLEVPKNLHLPEDEAAVKEAYEGWWAEALKNKSERMEWYNEAKFGCFIHWGVYAVPASIWNDKKYGGYSEHLMRVAKIPNSQYRTDLVETFNPSEFDADEWMRLAVAAGMKYFVITAKHHDGFALFRSEAYPYDISLTAFNKGKSGDELRDPMKELRDAARKYGIKFGFYYSHAFDWEHPDAPGNDWDYPTNPGGDRLHGGRNWWLVNPGFLVNTDRYLKEKSILQLKELILNYDPDIMWFDTPHKLPLYQNLEILRALREVDPENKIVVNGRMALFGDVNFGDYLNTGDKAAYFFPVADKWQWESIPTTNESYGYSQIDKSHKSPDHFIQLLATATSKGGNILMNVGPMGNGKWDETDIHIFKSVGDWLKVYGRAIYGNDKTDLPVQSWGVTTQKHDTTYLHVYKWPSNTELTVAGLTSDIDKAWILSDAEEKSLDFVRINDNDLVLKLPTVAPDSVNTVVALTLKDKKPAYPVRLLDSAGENVLLTFDAVLNSDELGYGDGKVNQNYVNNWTSNEQNMRWIFRLDKPAKGKISIQYNTRAATNSGTVQLVYNQRVFEVPYEGSRASKTIDVGEIQLSKGEHEFVLSGIEYEGDEFMRPMSLIVDLMEVVD